MRLIDVTSAGLCSGRSDGTRRYASVKSSAGLCSGSLSERTLLRAHDSVKASNGGVGGGGVQ